MRTILTAAILFALAGCSSPESITANKHQVMDLKISRAAGIYSQCLNKKWSDINPATRYYNNNNTHTIASYLDGQGEMASAKIQTISDNQSDVEIYLTSRGNSQQALLEAAKTCV